MSPRVRDPHRIALEDADPHSFNRPRQGSRARTKDRPDYSKAPVGVVLGVDRGRYEVELEGETLRAMKARELGRNSVIVGDRVRLVGDLSGTEGSLARITQVEPRDTVLLRTADDDNPTERPLVANADQLMIVTALASPPPRTGMIDRLLVAAYDAGISPILCFTKADLATPDELSAEYASLEVPIIVTQPGDSLDRVRELLDGHRTVLVGHSGVGKSTLINALVPGANRKTGDVNDVTGRGRHTSTSAIALRLPDDSGWVIDTPGVRSFGLSQVNPDSVIRAFGDLAEYAEHCPRGCDHAPDTPECALDAAVSDGKLDASRLAALRRILVSR